jgi:Fe-S cluster biogenesis protein NfuA
MMHELDRNAVDGILKGLIAPLIAVDGGVVDLVEVDSIRGCVRVRFGGTYRGSPCQGIVLKYVVEPLLKANAEGIVSVEMVV